MKSFTKIIFATIFLAVVLWGLIRSLTNKEIEVYEVNELIVTIKSYQNALIDNKSVAQLSDWKLQLIDLKKSIDVGKQAMTRKNFLHLRDSIDSFKPTMMSEKEKEKLHLNFKYKEEKTEKAKEGDSTDNIDTITSQMTSKKFEEMFGCKPDPDLL